MLVVLIFINIQFSETVNVIKGGKRCCLGISDDDKISFHRHNYKDILNYYDLCAKGVEGEEIFFFFSIVLSNNRAQFIFLQTVILHYHIIYHIQIAILLYFQGINNLSPPSAFLLPELYSRQNGFFLRARVPNIKTIIIGRALVNYLIYETFIHFSSHFRDRMPGELLEVLYKSSSS